MPAILPPVPAYGWNVQPAQQHQDGPAPITSPPADFAPATPATPVAPEVAPAAAPEAVAPVVPAEVPAEVDPFDDETMQQFGRPYVEKLRREAAERRTEAAKYKDVFGKYSEEDQGVWFDLATTWQTDPKAAAAMMERIAASVNAAVEAAPPEAVAPDGGALTPEAVQKMIADAQSTFMKEQETQQRAAGIVEQAKGLGYVPGSASWAGLFHVAQTQTRGDLAAAHTVMQAERQAVIDEAFRIKGQTAGPAPVNQGAAPGQRQVPKTWAEAAAALRASEGAQPGQ